MKYKFQWLLTAVCFLIASSTQMFAEGEKKEEVKVSIPISTGRVVHGNDARDGGAVPFSAYYQGGTIYVSTSAEFSVISVAVVNETTGQSWSSTTDISDGMGEISITNAGIGSYRVEIITEYGECFVGSFCL